MNSRTTQLAAHAPQAARVSPEPTLPSVTRPSTERSDARLIERLAAVVGIDVALALRYTDGQVSLLVRAFRKFVATYRQGVPTLLDASGEEHEVVLRWRTTAHSARGALGMIGATTMIEAVDLFECALGELAPRASLGSIGAQVHEDLLALVGRLSAELER